MAMTIINIAVECLCRYISDCRGCAAPRDYRRIISLNDDYLTDTLSLRHARGARSRLLARVDCALNTHALVDLPLARELRYALSAPPLAPRATHI